MSYPTEKLGKYIDILSGFAFKSKDFSDTGVPVIKIKNVTPPYVSLEDVSYIPKDIAEQQKKFQVHYNDILIALTGSHINQMASVVGRIARVKFSDKALLNQRVGKIYTIDATACSLDYVYYFLSQEKVKIELASKAGGAANQANISPSDVKNLHIPFPEIKIQQRIADMLLAYDDLIENNQKQIKLLEEAAQRLYREWFVDLRFPGYETTPIVNGVPEGWMYKTFAEVFDYVRGKSYTSKELSDTAGVLMANLKNIRAFGGYNRNAEKRFTGQYKANQVLSAGDVIMGVTDMTQERRLVGRVALVPDMGKEMIFSMDLIKLIPKMTNSLFLYSALYYGGLSKQISPLANGVNVLHLKPEAMMEIKMLIPSADILERYHQRFSLIVARIEILQKQCEIAVEARDRLLPKLMSGEIEV